MVFLGDELRAELRSDQLQLVELPGGLHGRVLQVPPSEGELHPGPGLGGGQAGRGHPPATLGSPRQDSGQSKRKHVTPSQTSAIENDGIDNLLTDIDLVN